MSKPAITITVSGVQGVGKSTIISMLAKTLITEGWNIQVTEQSHLQFLNARGAPAILLVEEQTSEQPNV